MNANQRMDERVIDLGMFIELGEPIELSTRIYMLLSMKYLILYFHPSTVPHSYFVEDKHLCTGLTI